MYAILAYLQRVVDRSADPSTERVLVLSIGAAASLILAFRALRVLNENWQDPLTEAERKSLREGKARACVEPLGFARC